MTWFRNPKVVSGILLLLIVGLVWFAGPRLGLESLEARFTWIFCIMLIWIAFLLAGKWIRERSAGLFRRILRREGDRASGSARQGSRPEVDLLRQRLLEAIETLKTSNLGKTRGKAALYELPWCLFIGHPEAGKSRAILNSGLKFTLAGKGGMPGSGTGGTRSCDWFFSTEGVLLDTAGHYTTQADERPEWIEFLKLLKKHRPKAPLNGILVALSLPELLQHETEAFTRYARQIRQRLNDADDVFGARIPVYLVFTKLDLLRGFGRFYDDLAEDERGQAWGATLPHDQPGGFDAVRVVDQYFESLCQGIAQMGTDKLAGSRANQQRPALFAFPLEFHGLKEPLRRFVGHLVEKDPYHSRPLLRGFYFTSALQEDRPDVTTGDRVAARFDLASSCCRPQEPAGSRPFFLESLFRGIVFPDMFLAGRSIQPRRSRLRLAGMAAGVVLTTLLAGCWAWSFVGNRKLIEEAREELRTSRRVYRSGGLGNRMKALQVLQYRLEQLYRHRQDGHPWRIGWGLYRGTEVEAILRAEYFAGVREIMLSPLRAALEEKLAAPPAPGKGTEETYNALKTYLMLHAPDRIDAAHLADQMPRHWREWLETNRGACPMPEISRMAERTVGFYISQRQEPDLPVIGNREDLVAQVRGRLRGEAAFLSPLERIYGEIKAQGNTRFAPVTVAAILGNKDMDLVGASVFVPGSFTREAWNTYFRGAILQASAGRFKGTDWVLASPLEGTLDQAGPAEERRDKLIAMYQADYIGAWERFIQGVAVHAFGDLDRAGAALARFSDPQASPIKLILSRAALETSWDSPSELSRTLGKARKDILDKTTEFLNGGGPAAPQAPQTGPIGARFAPLSGLVNGAGASLPAYLNLLGKLRGRISAIAASGDPGAGAHAMLQATLAGSGSELSETMQYVDSILLGGMTGEARDVVRPLLVRPLLESFAAILRPAGEHLDSVWRERVYAPWSGLATKYPFTDSGNDAPMSEIAKFLKPGDGTLARFIDKELGQLVVRRGDVYAVRAWSGQGSILGPRFLNALSRLATAGETLLQEGESCRFELQPVPTPGLTDILIEVDGQKILYRMGPQAWTTLTWPGPTASQGARLQVTSFSGATVQVQNFPGRLGFLRLLDQARVENPGGPGSALEWRVKASPPLPSRSPGDTPPLQGIRFNFRMVGGTNPLGLCALRHQALPQRVGN